MNQCIFFGDTCLCEQLTDGKENVVPYKVGVWTNELEFVLVMMVTPRVGRNEVILDLKEM